MSNIKYSIIIPHYNTPELLLRCVTSIPERNDIQIIVVDDNSPDAIDYQNLFPAVFRNNVQFHFMKESKGAGAARNEGLKYILGKWVLFADADDFYVDGFVDMLEEHYACKEDIVYFNIRSVMSDDLTKPAYRNDAKNKLFEKYAKTKDSALFRCNYCEPWGKMIRYRLIKDNNIRFDETRVDNDHYFSVVSGILAHQIRVVNKPLYVVTLRKASLSFNYADNMDKLLIRLCVKTSMQIFEKEHSYNIKQMLVRGLMKKKKKKKPRIFIQQLFKLKQKGIPTVKLLFQMFNPKYMK